MDITRSVELRACEAIRRDFSNDSGVRDYWKDRVYVGPEVGQDSSIITPQISVTPTETPFDPGTSGVSDTDVSVLVLIFEPITTAPVKLGELSAACKLRHLKKILNAGTIVLGASSAETEGKLIDPDNFDNPDTMKRYLNVESFTFRPAAPQRLLKGGQIIAIVYGFTATFRTRLANVSMERA